MASLAPSPAPFQPQAAQNFAQAADRARLTPAALAGLRGLAEAWRLTGAEVAALASLSQTTWDRIKAGTWKQSLSQDQLMRISALVGTFKALNLLFADGPNGSMADRWPRLRNAGPLFANLTPIEAMIEGGIPAMISIRQHVDALRGGL